jgi:membrane-associated protease RseP (regulator of RpoE activity)
VCSAFRFSAKFCSRSTTPAAACCSNPRAPPRSCPAPPSPSTTEPPYIVRPRPGATVSTLSGDRTQEIGRLADTLAIGGYVLPQPIVDLTDELSAIGGGVLKHFSVTFDQEHDRVTFYRESREPIATPPRRSPGMSFSKTPAYWKVANVVAGSPAAEANILAGELVTRINGEPVANWDLRRYEQLVATAADIAFAFLNGSTETTKTVRVFELVP